MIIMSYVRPKRVAAAHRPRRLLAPRRSIIPTAVPECTSIRYAERLAEAKAVRSVGSKGDFPYNNAAAESLNSLYKRELIDLRKDWTGVDDVVITTTRRRTGNAQPTPCLVGGHERRLADGVPGLSYTHDQRKRRLADLCITKRSSAQHRPGGPPITEPPLTLPRTKAAAGSENRSLTPGRGASKSLMSSCRLPRAHPVGCGRRGVVLWHRRRLSRRVWRWNTWPGDGRVERGWGESPWGTVSVGASLSGSSLVGRSGTCRGSRPVRHGALVRRC